MIVRIAAQQEDKRGHPHRDSSCLIELIERSYFTKKSCMSYKKILVAIDQSPQASAVFSQALAIAAQQASSLMILHVLSWDNASGPFIGTIADVDQYGSFKRLQQEHLQQQLAKVKTWLQTYSQEAIAHKVQAEFVCKVGSPGTQICQQARQWGADLIVLGRRGREGMVAALLGSVSNDVVHHASCSVLVVQGVLPT